MDTWELLVEFKFTFSRFSIGGRSNRTTKTGTRKDGNKESSPSSLRLLFYPVLWFRVSHSAHVSREILREAQEVLVPVNKHLENALKPSVIRRLRLGLREARVVASKLRWSKAGRALHYVSSFFFRRHRTSCLPLCRRQYRNK